MESALLSGCLIFEGAAACPTACCEVRDGAVRKRFAVAVRSLLIVLAIAALTALALRVIGRVGVPPRTGGWRELSEDELLDWPASTAGTDG